MFKDYPAIGVIVSIGLIVFLMWVVMKKTKALTANDQLLFLLIFLTTLFSSVWLVDKVVAPFTNLLTEKESDNILTTGTGLIGLIVGYYLRGGKPEDKPEK